MLDHDITVENCSWPLDKLNVQIPQSNKKSDRWKQHVDQILGIGSSQSCKTRENSNFLKNDKMVISVKIRNFSRSRMTKRTSSLESSREISIPRRISSNSKTVGISRFLRHREGCETLDMR